MAYTVPVLHARSGPEPAMDLVARVELTALVRAAAASRNTVVHHEH